MGAIGLGFNEWPVVMDALAHADLGCLLPAGRYTLLEQAALSPFVQTCCDKFLDWLRLDIPAALWRALTVRGLVDRAAPLPAG